MTARWCCRPGGTTARSGRWCTSSSECGRTSGAADSRSPPQLPPYEQRIAGRNIRLGDSAVDVVAARGGHEYRTIVHAGPGLRRLTLGHTLPLGTEVEKVLLDGDYVKRPRLRETNRGLEVLATVPGKAHGQHQLVVSTQ